jgi:hypothetical protein
MIAAGIGFDVAEMGTGKFARTQAGRIRKVQHETQALRRGRVPAIRPLKSVSNGTQEHPLAFGKGVGGIEDIREIFKGRLTLNICFRVACRPI